MTPEQKLEAIKEELAIYIERLDLAKNHWDFYDDCDPEKWEEQEQWARQGSPVDLEKIVEILDA